MKEQFLKDFGLDQKEINIFLILLSKGGLSASEISRQLQMPRSTVQFKCDVLKAKGLIRSQVTKNSHQYFAESPEKISYLLDRQNEQLNKMRQHLPEIISELQGIASSNSLIPKVKFFQGVEGIIEMFNDVLNDQSPLYGMTNNEGNLSPEVLDYLDKEYIPKRKKIRNPAWIIFNENESTKRYQTYDKDVNRISLLIPQNKYPFSACCHIYGNKVAFYSYVKSDLSGVIIENPHIFQTQFSLFKLSWNYARLLPQNTNYAKIDLASPFKL